MLHTNIFLIVITLLLYGGHVIAVATNILNMCPTVISMCVVSLIL
jgi:hypothetical protein